MRPIRTTTLQLYSMEVNEVAMVSVPEQPNLGAQVADIHLTLSTRIPIIRPVAPIVPMP